MNEMDRKIALLVPIYPPHFHFARDLSASLNQFDFNQQADLWFVFTNEEERAAFGECGHSIVLPLDLRIFDNRGIINIKKFYGLRQIQRQYEYIIVLDAESLFIKKIDLMSICNEYFGNKVLLGNDILPKGVTKTENIKASCKKYFEGHKDFEKLNNPLYLWFNQPCIYKTATLDDFWSKFNYDAHIKKLQWLDFDYYIYMFYLILFQGFRIESMGIKAKFGACENLRANHMFITGDRYKMQDIMVASAANLRRFDNPKCFILIHLDRAFGIAKKKIAVQIFGHLRTFESCAPYLRRSIIDGYDCDVFLHTWSEIDSSTKSWNPKKTKNNRKFMRDEIEQKIRDFYNPVDFIIEPQPTIADDAIVQSFAFSKDAASLSGMNFMFESMRKANELRHAHEKKQGMKYDVVLCIRPDIMLFSDPCINQILFEAENLGLDALRCRFVPALLNENVMLPIQTANDMFFFGSPRAIDGYISANSVITRELAEKHYLKITSIYTYNEIAGGGNPVHFKYEFNTDWTICRDADEFPNDQNISFVLQGEINPKATPRAIKAIRRFFPGAEIVLATYIGSDTSGLDCDKVALVSDPGFYPYDDRPDSKPNNINRHIQTTLAGLKAATRKYAFKLRSDFVPTGRGFLDFWGKFPKSDGNYRIFEKKILSCVFFARNPRVENPLSFHPSDIAFFGFRADLINLFDVPFMTESDSAYYKFRGRKYCRYVPEQHLWVECLRKNGKTIDFDHQRDFGRDIAIETEKYAVSNFIYLDWTQFCLDPPKRLLRFAGNDFDTCITHCEWQRLYKEHLDMAHEPPPRDKMREFIDRQHKIFRRYQVLAKIITLPFPTKLLRSFRRNLREKLIQCWTKDASFAGFIKREKDDRKVS